MEVRCRLDSLDQNNLIRQRYFPGPGRADKHQLRCRSGQAWQAEMQLVAGAVKGLEPAGVMEPVHVSG